MQIKCVSYWCVSSLGCVVTDLLGQQSNVGDPINDTLLDTSLLSLLNNGSMPSEIAAIDILKLANEYRNSVSRGMG